MNHGKVFHIFRNSPTGRENLLQSCYFCQKVNHLSLTIYIPISTQNLMYFTSGPLTIDLDSSYTKYQSTARQHAEEILADFDIQFSFFEPATFTAKVVADIPINWSIMACPRAISDQSSRIGLGHIGPKVRDIVKRASFPVLIPSQYYKPWSSVSTFFGGSELGLRAVKLGLHIAELANVPLTVYTQLDNQNREEFHRMLDSIGFVENESKPARRWVAYDTGTLEENLYDVPHDSLVVVGAAGTSLIRELVFGSKLELIQATLPNPILVIGPNSTISFE